MDPLALLRLLNKSVDPRSKRILEPFEGDMVYPIPPTPLSLLDPSLAILPKLSSNKIKRRSVCFTCVSMAAWISFVVLVGICD